MKMWYGDTSTRGALTILVEDHNMQYRRFLWGGSDYTVKAALTDIPPYLLDMRCGDFATIRFYGGPPGMPRWFNGSMLSMLCDASLFEFYTHTMTPEQQLMS